MFTSLMNLLQGNSRHFWRLVHSHLGHQTSWVLHPIHPTYPIPSRQDAKHGATLAAGRREVRVIILPALQGFCRSVCEGLVPRQKIALRFATIQALTVKKNRQLSPRISHQNVLYAEQLSGSKKSEYKHRILPRLSTLPSLPSLFVSTLACRRDFSVVD